LGEDIGWSESNAVIFANSVLGARTVKHPDFFDLFVALAARAPLSDVYLPENRQARVRLAVDLPETYDEAIWPLIGWIAGQKAPDCIPLIEGLKDAGLNEDDLKGLCAAFGTTSAAPMLHIQGVTPEGERAAVAGAQRIEITKDILATAWDILNSGPVQVDLVALGSPHFSLSEMRRFAGLMAGQPCAEDTQCIITLGRETYTRAQSDGLIDVLVFLIEAMKVSRHNSSERSDLWPKLQCSLFAVVSLAVLAGFWELPAPPNRLHLRLL
jgi:predicted aconitase